MPCFPCVTGSTCHSPVKFAVRWGMLLLGVALIAACGQSTTPEDTVASDPAVAVASGPASYVGEAACAGCHAEEAAAWRQSQHAKAMQHANADTVLADFDDTRFTYNGITTRFFRRGDEFWVNTDGPDGQLTDFKVAYTFAVDPLQQYLVAFPDGRLQALSIAWDTRPAGEGGQRWFHLYPDEKIDHADELHWTGAQQNWNYMCADCHSTDLRRNFDADKNTYATTWQDINVACEACHGPGSQHVSWAEQGADLDSSPHKGLSLVLSEKDVATWLPVAGTGNVRRSHPLEHERQTETCAVCHSRRGSINTVPGPTGQLLDTHDPSLLTGDLYFADGQQEGEVFTHGSFLQSKMHAAGVTCSDCHDPHTAKLRLPGNATCTQCHAPATFDTPEHHHHMPLQSSSATSPRADGTQCVDCHMPERTYMVVDPRKDHSFRIPRPDWSVALGTPNACQSCHADKGDAWAAEALERWNGPPKEGFQHWAPAFHAARTGAADAATRLATVLARPGTPGIVRATAIHELRGYPGRELLAAIDKGLKDPDPLVRIAALDALGEAPPDTRLQALPLTTDPLLAVRAHAGLTLAPLPVAQVPVARREDVAKAYAAYESTQQASAERPEAHLNLGLLHAQRGDIMRAEADYRQAIARDPDFVPAYINLSDLYRASGREGEAGKTLENGLKVSPDAPALLHALGLQRVREGDAGAALPLLAQAAAGQPDSARYAYVHAVAVHATGDYARTTKLLDEALSRMPNDRDLLFTRASFALEQGDVATARRFAERLAKAAPDDPRGQQLLQHLPR